MMEKYRIDTTENMEYLMSQAKELLDFGRAFPSPGGSSYYLGDDKSPMKDRPRQTWITARMAHVYSIGALLGYDGCGELADAAITGLRGELHDDANGGWYAGLTSDGDIVPQKQCYAHAFVILAATSALLAKRPGAQELLEDAIDVYDRFFWNEKEGLSADTWDTQFKVLSEYRGLNANMHSVEAFLAAADVTGNEKYRVRAGRIIDRVVEWAKENHARIPEHFTSEWKPCLYLNRDKPDDQFKPFGATPGHGIEWARLIVQWALSTYDRDDDMAKKYIGSAEKLYDRAVTDAWNCDGAEGICYTTDWEGAAVVHDRMHWTLAEAINTSSTLYRVTGKDRYSDDYSMFMKYLDESVLDHEKGSWFHQLDRENHVIATVWPGKPDLYHAFQAMLIPYVKKPEYSIAIAVKKRDIMYTDAFVHGG